MRFALPHEQRCRPRMQPESHSDEKLERVQFGCHVKPTPSWATIVSKRQQYCSAEPECAHLLSARMTPPLDTRPDSPLSTSRPSLEPLRGLGSWLPGRWLASHFAKKRNALADCWVSWTNRAWTRVQLEFVDSPKHTMVIMDYSWKVGSASCNSQSWVFQHSYAHFVLRDGSFETTYSSTDVFFLTSRSGCSSGSDTLAEDQGENDNSYNQMFDSPLIVRFMSGEEGSNIGKECEILLKLVSILRHR